MKIIKTVSFVVMAMTLMAVVGVSAATATVMCKNGVSTTSCTEPYGAGTVIEATLTSGTTMILETAGGTILDTCTSSTMKAITENKGSAVETYIDDMTSLTFGNCTRTTNTVTLGSLVTHHISGTDNGTVTAYDPTHVTIDTIFGSCTYGNEGELTLGTLKGGNPASITINTNVSKIMGNFACPNPARWTASYTVTAPKPTYPAAG